MPERKKRAANPKPPKDKKNCKNITSNNIGTASQCADRNAISIYGVVGIGEKLAKLAIKYKGFNKNDIVSKYNKLVAKIKFYDNKIKLSEVVLDKPSKYQQRTLDKHIRLIDTYQKKCEKYKDDALDLSNFLKNYDKYRNAIRAIKTPKRLKTQNNFSNINNMNPKETKSKLPSKSDIDTTKALSGGKPKPSKKSKPATKSATKPKSSATKAKPKSSATKSMVKPKSSASKSSAKPKPVQKSKSATKPKPAPKSKSATKPKSSATKSKAKPKSSASKSKAKPKSSASKSTKKSK